MKWLILLLFCPSLWGIYSGNPLAPRLPTEGFYSSKEENIQLRIGYIGDFALQIPLKHNGEYSGNWQLATASIVIHRRFLFELMGGSSFAHLNLNHHVQIESSASGGWSYGARMQGLIKRWGKVGLGISASGLLSYPRTKWETLQGAYVASYGRHSKIASWQAGISVGWRGETFVPYIGAKYSNLVGHIGDEHFRAKRQAGLVLGCGLVAYTGFVLNLEARVIDEESLTLTGSAAF